MERYKQLLKKVVKKIDKWHSNEEERKQGTFENDDDYVGLSPSPSNFSSSSCNSFSKEETKDQSLSKDRHMTVSDG